MTPSGCKNQSEGASVVTPGAPSAPGGPAGPALPLLLPSQMVPRPKHGWGGLWEASGAPDGALQTELSSWAGSLGFVILPPP